MELISKREFKLPIDKLFLSKYKEDMGKDTWITEAADQLALLYEKKFGGKDSGRYRIASKTIRDFTKRRRLYEGDVQALSRELLERGYVLIDMDSFVVVMSANSFVNYRRANEQCFVQRFN